MLILPAGLQQKRTAELSIEDMAWLANGEDVCRKLGLTICCLRCLLSGLRADAAIQGDNDATDHVLKVTCQCRQLTYRAKAES